MAKTDFERVCEELLKSQGLEDSQENVEQLLDLSVRASHFYTSESGTYEEYVDLLAEIMILEVMKMKGLQDAYL